MNLLVHNNQRPPLVLEVPVLHELEDVEDAVDGDVVGAVPVVGAALVLAPGADDRGPLGAVD